MNHSKQDRTERGIDEFPMDYCFPGDEFGFRLAILVLVEKYSGMKAFGCGAKERIDRELRSETAHCVDR